MEIAGQAAPDPTPEPEEKKNAPPPPPGIPPTGNCLKFSTHIRIYKRIQSIFKQKKENRAKNNPYQQPFTPRQASTVVPQQAPLVQVIKRKIRAES